jgi:hypothetical protein
MPKVSSFTFVTHVPLGTALQSASLVHAPKRPPSQVPDTHVPPVPHAIVHEPQCISSPDTSMHAPPHASSAPSQACPQVCPSQVAWPFAGATHGVQAVPHVAIDVSSTQPVEHRCCPAAHEGASGGASLGAASLGPASVPGGTVP